MRECIACARRNPARGLAYLVEEHFVEGSARALAHMLLTRRGFSKSAIGAFLGDLQNPLALPTLRYVSPPRLPRRPTPPLHFPPLPFGLSKQPPPLTDRLNRLRLRLRVSKILFSLINSLIDVTRQ